MNLAALLPLAIKASIVLTVFGLGLRASVADASYLFRRPRQLARAVLAMNVVMPLVATCVALAFALHPAVKIALVALAVSPVPPILPRKQLKAGGHHGYVMGLLVAAALLAIAFVPSALAVLHRAGGRSLLQTDARAVATTVAVTVLLPLFLGVMARRATPARAMRLEGPVSRTGGILLIAAVLPVLFVQWRALVSLVGNGTLLAIAAVAVTGIAVGHLCGGPDPEDRTVLALATASRHPGVAMAVATTHFPGEKLVLPAIVWYLLISIAVSALYLGWRRRRHAAAGPTLGGETSAHADLDARRDGPVAAGKIEQRRRA